MFTKNEMTTRITSIASRRKTWNADVQTVLAHIAGHAYEHGDVTFASKLLNACKGADKVALVRYLREFCFTNVANDGSVTLNKKTRKEADFVDGDAVVAYLTDEATPWYDFAVTTADAAKILDPTKRVESMIKQVEKGEHELKFNEEEFCEAVARLNAAIAISRANAAAIAAQEEVEQAA